ncbi:MAG: RNA pseudouridine synthase [Zetaproteobacteria bacterium]|nr:MAG: RNA pseudouridine synthase [Zetaproteobacteria bacterium]
MSEDRLSFVAEEVHVNLRADKFLSVVCDDLSRSRLQKLIVDGRVTLNGEVLKSLSTKVGEGDVFSVCVPEPEAGEPEAEDIALDILYEDDDLLVINKAVGMVVHPGAGNWSGTLVNALLHHCGDTLSGIGGVIRPGIVHRLDKDTSGLIMVAKNDHAHKFLSAQFADRTLSRVYHALVLGVPMPIKGTINREIGRHRHNRLKMSVMSNAPREARTHYKVLENYNESCALVECKLESGRTHQIRVHMEALGHPLIGDPLYGPQQTALIARMKNAGYDNEFIKEIVDSKCQLLFAKQISFVHPRTEKQMSFECPVPELFVNVLKKLRK